MLLVEAIRYKPEGRGFDSLSCDNPSGRTVALGSTQRLTKDYEEHFLVVKAAGT